MKQTFDVTGMTCAACSARVTKATSGVAGVNEAVVNLLKNSMEVDYDGNYEGISWGNINSNTAQENAISRDMATTEF